MYLCYVDESGAADVQCGEVPDVWREDVPTYTVSDSQRKAAKIAGFIYLLTDVTAIFAEFGIRSRLIVDGNAAKTVANIVAAKRLFRVGIATDLFTFAAVVALIIALYVVVKPVSRSLAMLAAFGRLMEASLCVFMTLSGLDVVRLLSGDAYLRAFDADRIQALVMLAVGSHGAGYNVAMIFFGLGSTVFSYLFFKSRYIPRALAGLGIFSSLLVAICTFIFVVFPELENVLGASFYIPVLIFELTAGFWLLLKGLRPAAESGCDAAGVRAQAGGV